MLITFLTLYIMHLVNKQNSAIKRQMRCGIICILLVAAVFLLGYYQGKPSFPPEDLHQPAAVNDHWADLFYVPSTNVLAEYDRHGKEVYNARLTEEEKQTLGKEIAYIEKKYSDSLNVFAPYYHQFTMNAILLSRDSFEQAYDIAKADAKKAFDYYLSHHNNGRKFILAGFSQGAMIARDLLKTMDDEPMSRCVGVYMMGFELTKDDLYHPHIKAAANDTDGLVISFNSVIRPGNRWKFLSGHAATCINPLNWSKDTTAAQLCYHGDTAWVRVDKEYRILTVTGLPEDKYTQPEAERWYGAGCLHRWDLLFYTDALHRNMLKRAYR